jgi:hypothetical protein
MISTIETALQGKDIHYNCIVNRPHQKVLKCGFNLENGRCDTFIDIRPEEQKVLIYDVLPVNIPENKRLRVAEFLTRANYNLQIGNFELDLNDGDLRYKSSFIYDEFLEASEETFLRHLFVSLFTLDRYLPGIMAVSYGGVSPTDAIGAIENRKDPSNN